MRRSLMAFSAPARLAGMIPHPTPRFQIAKRVGAALGIGLLALVAPTTASAQQVAVDPDIYPEAIDGISKSRSGDWDTFLAQAGPTNTAILFGQLRSRVEGMQTDRAVTTISLAQQIDATCPFLDAGVRSMIAGTVARHERWNSVSHGAARAKAFLSARPCTHATMKALQASLNRVLTPAAPQTAAPKQDATTMNIRLKGLAVPELDQNIDGAVIGWSNDFKASIQAAKLDGKPILLLLGDRSGHCPWCDVLLRDLREFATLNRLAGRFHAVLLDVDDDQHAPGRVMFDTLGAKGLPTTSLFTVSAAGHIAEQVRINGHLIQREFVAKLRAAFPDAPVVENDRSNWKALDAALSRTPQYCMPIETLALCNERTEISQ